MLMLLFFLFVFFLSLTTIIVAVPCPAVLLCNPLKLLRERLLCPVALAPDRLNRLNSHDWVARHIVESHIAGSHIAETLVALWQRHPSREFWKPKTTTTTLCPSTYIDKTSLHIAHIRCCSETVVFGAETRHACCRLTHWWCSQNKNSDHSAISFLTKRLFSMRQLNAQRKETKWWAANQVAARIVSYSERTVSVRFPEILRTSHRIESQQLNEATYRPGLLLLLLLTYKKAAFGLIEHKHRRIMSQAQCSMMNPLNEKTFNFDDII